MFNHTRHLWLSEIGTIKIEDIDEDIKLFPRYMLASRQHLTSTAIDLGPESVFGKDLGYTLSNVGDIIEHYDEIEKYLDDLRKECAR
jgi:hypothetical protein